MVKSKDAQMLANSYLGSVQFMDRYKGFHVQFIDIKCIHIEALLAFARSSKIQILYRMQIWVNLCLPYGASTAHHKFFEK